MELENHLILEKFIASPEYVWHVIDLLKTKFNTELFEKYNVSNYKDSVAYYSYGKCISFAYILSEIFERHCSFYDDFSSSSDKEKDGHIYTKIGNHFFDVTGYYESLPSRYKECSYDEFLYMSEFYCANDEHVHEIEEELIIYGKEILRTVLADLNHNQTR